VNLDKWIGPTLIIAIAAALISVGALYARVDALESANRSDDDIKRRLATVEGLVVGVDHDLDRIEKKVDTLKER
jgi:uncharacterized protein YoxC